MQIDYKSREPIYEQIMQNVKQMILSGVWKADDQLPSVRQLSRELGINPNTIQKAYNELEWQGVIYSLRGRGSFVSANQQELMDRKAQQLLLQLQDVVTQLKELGVDKDRIQRELDIIWEKGVDNR